jgi:arylformamidase
VTLIDISVPIHEGMPIYDRNPGVRLERVLSLARGDSANVSRLELGLHTGTHVDAPIHILADGAGVETLPLDAFLGPAYVADATAAEEGAIDADVLARCAIPADAERVLVKTRNGALWDGRPFTRDFVRLDGSGAEFLIARGVRLVGIDYLSIGDHDAHRLLLGGGVVALEGLELRRVAPGWYDLLCLPLDVVGADGAAARAVLRPR